MNTFTDYLNNENTFHSCLTSESEASLKVDQSERTDTRDSMHVVTSSIKDILHNPLSLKTMTPGAGSPQVEIRFVHVCTRYSRRFSLFNGVFMYWGFLCICFNVKHAASTWFLIVWAETKTLKCPSSMSAS
ncbi:hypothetical protein PHMEG_00023121 [Phytophthora megakarya]|uniref:Uncharacterized protein n=1 Tax=Phytophthora megakarya TaxID=4795 RepID=A0A225VIV4_9STRA|nr:hypothetical protein PHMEG_00023121 [Phytophthora megakarya]